MLGAWGHLNPVPLSSNGCMEYRPRPFCLGSLPQISLGARSTLKVMQPSSLHLRTQALYFREG